MRVQKNSKKTKNKKETKHTLTKVEQHVVHQRRSQYLHRPSFGLPPRTRHRESAYREAPKDCTRGDFDHRMVRVRGVCSPPPCSHTPSGTYDGQHVLQRAGCLLVQYRDEPRHCLRIATSTQTTHCQDHTSLLVIPRWQQRIWVPVHQRGPYQANRNRPWCQQHSEAHKRRWH